MSVLKKEALEAKGWYITEIGFVPGFPHPDAILENPDLGFWGRLEFGGDYQYLYSKILESLNEFSTSPTGKMISLEEMGKVASEAALMIADFERRTVINAFEGLKDFFKLFKGI